MVRIKRFIFSQYFFHCHQTRFTESNKRMEREQNFLSTSIKQGLTYRVLNESTKFHRTAAPPSSGPDLSVRGLISDSGSTGRKSRPPAFRKGQVRWNGGEASASGERDVRDGAAHGKTATTHGFTLSLSLSQSKPRTNKFFQKKRPPVFIHPPRVFHHHRHPRLYNRSYRHCPFANKTEAAAEKDLAAEIIGESACGVRGGAMDVYISEEYKEARYRERKARSKGTGGPAAGGGHVTGETKASTAKAKAAIASIVSQMEAGTVVAGGSDDVFLSCFSA